MAMTKQHITRIDRAYSGYVNLLPGMGLWDDLSLEYLNSERNVTVKHLEIGKKDINKKMYLVISEIAGFGRVHEYFIQLMKV